MQGADAEGIRGIGRESSALTRLFFSEENREGLQQAIRYQAYVDTGTVIGRQSDRELMVVMRRVIEDGASAYQGESLTDAVKRLNDQTLQAAIPDVIGAVRQHQRYIREIQTPVPVPLEHAVSMSSRGTGAMSFPGLM